ncbi:hypothetical protein QUF72_05410 [Desulfobacterales bacterium HSG2]|nr:hypothetical protein [Desulfobacterales bacterium HSG2]
MDSGSECRKPVSGLTKVREEPASDILPGMTGFVDSGSECRKPRSELAKVWEEPASDILPGMTGVVMSR